MVNRMLEIDNIYIRDKLVMVNRILQKDNIYIRDNLEMVNRILEIYVYQRQGGDGWHNPPDK